jgi:hypothetical protein
MRACIELMKKYADELIGREFLEKDAKFSMPMWISF